MEVKVRVKAEGEVARGQVFVYVAGASPSHTYKDLPKRLTAVERLRGGSRKSGGYKAKGKR